MSIRVKLTGYQAYGSMSSFRKMKSDTFSFPLKEEVSETTEQKSFCFAFLTLNSHYI